nr:Mannosyltransferase [Leptospira interrogans serovar Copenhageni/Icterohaemorrhagiae]
MNFLVLNKIKTPLQPKNKSIRKTKDFSYPVISYLAPIYSLSEFLGHPWMERMDLLDIPHFNAPLPYLNKSIVTIHDIIPFRMKEFHSNFRKTNLYANCISFNSIVFKKGGVRFRTHHNGFKICIRFF